MAGTTTPNLALYKPAIGETGWGTLVDANWDTLDTTVSAMTVQSPNPIINQAMDVWQRGTTFAGIAATSFSADRWNYSGTASAAIVTLNRSTNVPSVASAGVLFNYSLEVDVTTADASVAAGDIVYLIHKIEGYNWRHFAQRDFTISFWVSSTKTGTYSLCAQNSGNNRSWIGTYVVNSTDTWEHKTVTITASPSVGTWDYTNGIGLSLSFVLMGGSTFFNTTGQWNNAALQISASQVNAVDNAANFFRLTGVKLEVGSIATALQYRAFQDELALCKRYYQKSFNYATTPAQNVGSLAGSYVFGSMVGASTLFHTGPVLTNPPLRTTPTTTLFNPMAANAQIRNDSLSTDTTGAGAINTGESQFALQATTPAATVAGHRMAVHWTADAEL